MTKTVAVAALLKAAHAIPHLLAPGETPEEWDSRVQTIVEKNYDAARTFSNGKGWTAFELALATTVLEGNETQFDRRVHAGEQHPIWTQDKGLAKCLGQLHETKDQKGNPAGPVPRSTWEKLTGLDLESTELCARVTTQVLVSHANQCGVFLGRRAQRNLVAQAFASYAYGGKCKPEDREWKRADQWVSLMGRFGPKPDVPGYRRVPPAEVPPEIQRAAAGLVSLIGKDADLVPGHIEFVEPGGGDKWGLRIERHASGKVGVSVFEKDEK